MIPIDSLFAIWKYCRRALLCVETSSADQYCFNAHARRYDTDHSGGLDHSQLKTLLVDLNDGHEVTDKEVDDIMQLADNQGDQTIDKTEVSVTHQS